MKKTITSFLCAFALPLVVLAVSDLKESKFTQVFNDVQIIASDKSVKSVTVNDLFKMPDILRTGPASRAELVAVDRTITRVGANTIFSFDQANRTIDLQQGSLLFHSDKGMGGGTIRTGAATASVLGTTLIVVTTPDGGFKVLLLEGHGEVRYANGKKQQLKAGQMTFILPGGFPSPVIFFRLDSQVHNSLLVNGFIQPLASMPLIAKVMALQNQLIQSGKAVDLGLLAGDSASPTTIKAIPFQAGNPIDQLSQQTSDSDFDNQQSQSSQPSLTGAALALTQPQTIIPVAPVFISPGFNATDPNNFLNTTPHSTGLFYGVPGSTITVNGPSVDLSSYANQSTLGIPYFDMAAVGDVNISSSANFTGLTPSDELYLSAGGQISIPLGSTVEADAGLFQLSSYSPMSFDNVSLVNNSGELALLSQSGITLQNSSSVVAPQVNITAGGNIEIDNSTVASGVAVVAAPVGSALNLASTGSTGQIALNNVDVSTFLSVNLSAKTIILENTAFALGSVVNLHPASPSVNFMAGSGSGYVVVGEANLYNISYGIHLVNNLSQITFSGAASSTPGINVY